MLPRRLPFIASPGINDAGQSGWEEWGMGLLSACSSKAVGPIGSKSPQWAVMVMGIHRALLFSSRLGESLALARRRVEERNSLISMAGHHNPSCRTERKNWDRKPSYGFKQCWVMASSV